LAIVSVWTISVLAFASVHFIPGDVVTLAFGLHPSEEAMAATRHQLGLDQPAPVQYFRWLGRLLQGNLGLSLRTQEPIAAALRQRVPVTIELAIFAVLLAIAIGVPSGILAAVRQYTIVDQIATFASLVGFSVPDFWLATLLILVLTSGLGWLPAGGVLPSILEDPAGNLKRMLMPALALGLPSAAVYFRMMRSSMLEVVGSEYMRTAYSKGLGERAAIMGHALKNALIPVITLGGLAASWMLGGSFIIETIFNLPGLGRATVKAIYDRDFTMLQGSLLVYATFVVGLAIAVDILYVWLDPRIRYE